MNMVGCQLKGSSSVEKALSILLEFAPTNQPMGTLEMSKKLQIHKSTMSRMLHQLKDTGFLQQHPETKKYLLGTAASEIGNSIFRSLNSRIVTIAKPYVKALREETGESVALEVLSGTSVVVAYHCEGRGHITFSFQQGENVDIQFSAGAKAIMAHSPVELVEYCLNPKLRRFTSNTIVSRSAYQEMLKKVREKGLAYDTGERFEDTRAIAAPILSQGKEAVAALVIAGPAFRLTSQFMLDVGEILTRRANEISHQLFV